MSLAYLDTIKNPPQGVVSDFVRLRVWGLILYATEKAAVPFGSATTRQLRHFLSPPLDPAIAATSSAKPEAGPTTQWRKI
ncbi:hypothetical protein BGX23_012076 [Mortierella sp. AD031]|nr:hypothetical protein BGX23_012076 [Mortierella sp. AD031]KAG0219256.1 hypothetical protein BGX33_003802 [Mortierella sp. NVP41]